MKHYGLTLNLKNDPSVIEKYKAYHRDAWPEVLAALKSRRYHKDEHLSTGVPSVHGDGNC